MKVLVTGGCGFIGSHVVDAFIDKGWEAVIVDNLSMGRVENKNERAKLYVEDICGEGVAQVFMEEKPDLVVHLAAQISVPFSVEKPLLDAEINIMGTIRLLELSKLFGVRKFLFSSTGGAIYGDADKVPTGEEFVPEPASPYAISKFASEKYIRYYHRQFALDYVILRYSNVFGPRQIPHGEAGVVAIFVEKLLAGQVPVLNCFPDEPRGMVRDYCFVKDVARANVLASEMDMTGTFNIGTGRGTHTIDLYREIVKAFRKGGKVLSEQYDRMERGDARPGDIRVSTLDAGLAEKKLGWKTMYGLAEGLWETIQWYDRGHEG